MSPKFLGILLAFLAMQAVCNASTNNDDTIDLTRYPPSVSDPKTGVEYDAMYVSLNKTGTSVLVYGGLPCHCNGLDCSCCARIHIFRWHWNICFDAKLHLGTPPLTVMLVVNDKQLVRKEIGSEISFCGGVPHGDICIGVSNVNISKGNFHFCTKVYAKLFSAKITVFYKCLDINKYDISYIMLMNNQAIPQIEYEPHKPEVYDMKYIENNI